MLAGPADSAEFESCAAALGERCHRAGLLPQSDMPALLAAADAVPVPQRRVTFTESQLPVKALEAMAMAPLRSARYNERGTITSPTSV